MEAWPFTKASLTGKKSAVDAVTECHVQQQKLSKVKVFNNVIYETVK